MSAQCFDSSSSEKNLCVCVCVRSLPSMDIEPNMTSSHVGPPCGDMREGKLQLIGLSGQRCGVNPGDAVSSRSVAAAGAFCHSSGQWA